MFTFITKIIQTEITPKDIIDDELFIDVFITYFQWTNLYVGEWGPR